MDWPNMSQDLIPIEHHGGVEEHSSGYLLSSGKLHAQESKRQFWIITEATQNTDS